MVTGRFSVSLHAPNGSLVHSQGAGHYPGVHSSILQLSGYVKQFPVTIETKVN